MVPSEYEIYFSSEFCFRHISRAEGEWNIGNKIYEKNISILHETPCDNWFIATLQNITQSEPHNKTLRYWLTSYALFDVFY